MAFGLFKRKGKAESTAFDRARFTPTLRSSICTGEKVAGFKEIATGRFIECDLIQSESDLTAFAKRYGLAREEIHQEW